MTLLLEPERSIPEPSKSGCRSGSARSLKMSAAGVLMRRDTDTGLHPLLPTGLLPCLFLPHGALIKVAARAAHLPGHPSPIDYSQWRERYFRWLLGIAAGRPTSGWEPVRSDRAGR